MDSGFTDICDFSENCTKILLGFYSPNSPYSVYKESTINMLLPIYKAFKAGIVNGRSACVFSFGPIIVPLIAMDDFVEEITVLQSCDAGLKEFQNWKNKHPDAFDWSSAHKFLTALKGKSDESGDVEKSLRGKTKIVKWDIRKDNYDSKFDIAASIWGLEPYSKNHDDCRVNLRKLSYLINLGGFIILFSVINATHFKFGEDKFHLLPCDESFYRKVITEGGFDVKHTETFDRELISDAIDHEGGIFIVAQKVMEPPGRERSEP